MASLANWAFASYLYVTKAVPRPVIARTDRSGKAVHTMFNFSPLAKVAAHNSRHGRLSCIILVVFGIRRCTPEAQGRFFIDATDIKRLVDS